MGLNNFLFGGDATKSFDQQIKPKYAGYVGTALNTELEGGGVNKQLDYTQANAARAQMQGLAGQLQGVAGGQSAGAGELAVNRQMHSAAAAQQAMARMARGANSVLAARSAARNTMDLGVAGAGQAAQAQMQDQAAARGQLQGLLGGMRGGDLQTQQLEQGQQGQNAQIIQSYLAQLMGLDQARMQRGLAHQQVAAQDTGHGAQLLQAAGQAGMMAATGGFGGGPILGGAGGGGMSPIAAGYPGAGGYYTPQSPIGQASGPIGQPSGPITSPNQTGMFGQYTR